MENIYLKSNNLYNNSTNLIFEDGQGLLERPFLSYTTTRDDIIYTIKEFDRLDLIAYNHYKGDTEDASKYWWILADVNLIDNPLDLSELVGSTIVIPSLTNILITL